MRFREHEVNALKSAAHGQTVGIWRPREPDWKEGKRYYRESVQDYLTVVVIQLVTAADVDAKIIRRSGYKNPVEFAEEMKGVYRLAHLRCEVWEMRLALGDYTDRYRLLRPGGGYTDVPAMAMRDEPEAITPDEWDRSQEQTRSDRVQIARQFQRRVAEEAEVIFQGDPALRNLNRTLESLVDGKNR